MLSILIPIYNYDVRPFVGTLLAQCNACGIEFEILCYDDYSIAQYRDLNKSLQDHPNVIYQEMDTNLGRSKIRNLLAASARFNYLLFADCDSAVVSDHYIQNYVDELEKSTLIYGGRTYSKHCPNNEYLLHWKYGTQRESKTAALRQEHKYRSFMTNNFVIPSDLFRSIEFDESIKGYGHEDTLFGKMLGIKGVIIKHIDNPLEHIGLETNSVFLDKTEEAVQNLVKLHKKGKLLKQDVRLIQAYYTVKKIGVKEFVRRNVNRREQKIRKQLVGTNPSMRLYDQWKLKLFISYMSEV